MVARLLEEQEAVGSIPTLGTALVAQLEEQRSPNPQVVSSSLAEGLSAVVLVAGGLAFNQERGIRFLYGALRECGGMAQLIWLSPRRLRVRFPPLLLRPRNSIGRVLCYEQSGYRFESCRGFSCGCCKMALPLASNQLSGVRFSPPALGGVAQSGRAPDL